MFQPFSKAVHARFVEMSKGELFTVNVSELFDKYLSFFPEGTNPMFRTRTEYDCQCCKTFVRRLGKVVAIKDGQIITVWDDLGHLPQPFDIVAMRMSKLIRSAPIKTVFRTKERKYGVEHNYDLKTNQRYEHFHGVVADKHFALDPETKRGAKDAIFHVFRRGLLELRAKDFDDVIDLIESNGLYKGEEFKPAIVGFRALLKAYHADVDKDTFVWENIDNKHAGFRSTAIGTLFIDLAEGQDFDASVASYERKVAGDSYKRPAGVFTQKQLEAAVQTMADLGIGGAIYRRYAKLSDVSVNDMLFVDNAARSKMKDGLTLLLESSVKKTAPDEKKATPIKAEDFIKDVLPKAKSLQLHLENRHAGNFVSLTGADGPERIFKWNNPFAWSYIGDVADSVKQRVKAAGGNINAKLRISLSWFNTDDLDLHAMTPDLGHISFMNKQNILDVDMNAHTYVRNPVENLAFNTLHTGVYDIWVHQYRRRETTDIGFAIEVECAGVLHQYSYAKALSPDTRINCFKLTMKNGALDKIVVDDRLVGGSASQEKWGVKTEALVPVVAVMHSPNHWGDDHVGAKHTIFALENCRNPDPTRGIYNDYLRSDLDKHRKVFEVLGAKTKCAFTEDQVSGVGFTAARGETVTIVVDGRRSYTLSF